MTRDAWWKLADANRDALRALVLGFYPVGAKSSPDYPITAGAAEVMCRQVRTELADAGVDPAAAFDRAFADRDAGRLYEVVNATWFGIPESTDAHGLPGFYALCDLCSEYESDEHATSPADAERSSVHEAVDVLLKALGWASGGLGAAAVALVTERDTLRARVAELEAGLKPFAVYAVGLTGRPGWQAHAEASLILDPGHQWKDHPTVGDCRRAAALLDVPPTAPDPVVVFPPPPSAG